MVRAEGNDVDGQEVHRVHQQDPEEHGKRGGRDELVAVAVKNALYLFVDEFDDGSGMKKVWTPYWTLKSTYWWRMTFPAKKLITVKHDYKPSVGGTVGTTFLEDGKARGERFDEYKAKYCMDPSFVKPIEAAAMRNPDKQAPFVENWISYVLMTGGNWATSIGKFKLTIDKGSAKNMISFCGKGVKKVGPTTFEMTAEDFYPEKNLEILLMLPMTQDGGN